MRDYLLGILLVILFLAAWWLNFHTGFYSAPDRPLPEWQLTNYVQPVPGQQASAAPYEATVLIDVGHADYLPDLTYLASKLAAEGLRAEAAGYGELVEKLPGAGAVIFLSPSGLSDDEFAALQRFERLGGRILILVDPNFPGDGSVSRRFGIRLQGGYLYDEARNNGNYRYILVDDFTSDDTTAGLTQIALYSACDVEGGKALATAAPTTRRFLDYFDRRYSPWAISEDGGVMVLCDVTFLERGFHEVGSNDGLASNLAAFLAGANRSYVLDEYPYYLPNANIAYSNESLLASAQSLRAGLPVDMVGTLALGDEGGVVMALYESGMNLSGVEIGEEIVIDGVGSLGRADSALALWDGQRLYLLADTPDAMVDLVKKLNGGAIGNYMLRDDLAFLIGEESSLPILEEPA